MSPSIAPEVRVLWRLRRRAKTWVLGVAISKKTVRHQRLWLLVIVLTVMLASAISTLWLRGFFESGGDDEKGYQNITLTDAIITCENQIRHNYKNQLRHVTLDNLSSRYDRTANLYRVFFTADLQTGNTRAPSKPVLVSCLVEGARGKVKELDLFEKTENAAEPIKKRDGGIFGWP